MREMRGYYFKDFNDGQIFISGLPIPKDADGVCRNIRFINCTFHVGCQVPCENVEYINCDNTADSWLNRF